MIRAFRDRNADPFGGLMCAEPPHLPVMNSSMVVDSQSRE